jgi:hypothetical protein
VGRSDRTASTSDQSIFSDLVAASSHSRLCCDSDTSLISPGAPHQRQTRNPEIAARDSGSPLGCPGTTTGESESETLL